ncbi:hypothetical protein [Paramicrobacterium chengjingii]|uniref:Uncharacterized protein n=2 Tax=Paramicrobacterium chengjingii TaxID=2769067 RepID=A0ABX6YHL0_9MICO|nr:hypothetical protein [Microbacterium chengjingii]QPZ37862.1 hypothetical protein HCR76_13745 [Microbacterium chengjingii]
MAAVGEGGAFAAWTDGVCTNAQCDTEAMGWLIGALIVVLLSAVLCALALIARRVRRRGAAGQAMAAAMAAYDEGFHTTAHDTFIEMQAENERTQQTPAPGKNRR